MLDKTPLVFISYCWSIKEKALSIASRLRTDGVDVRLDQWDLKSGQDKYAFMEQCVRDDNIDKVLILSDKSYTEKANIRSGGVGDETIIISPEIYKSVTQERFIPIVLEMDSKGEPYLPSYLKSRIYINLTDENFEKGYRSLLREIYDAPEHQKPELGNTPEWIKNDEPRSLYELRNSSKDDFIDNYIAALKLFFRVEVTPDAYIKDFTSIKEYRDVFLDFIKVKSKDPHFGLFLADSFEKMYNNLCVLCNHLHSGSFSPFWSEIYKTHIWELFICSTAFMIHFEMFSSLNEILVHTYYINDSDFGTNYRARNYTLFRNYPRYMEEVVKPELSKGNTRLFTLAGNFLCKKREYAPIYTGKAIANADLFLYQVFNALDIGSITEYNDPWFPTCYVYADERHPIWIKMSSKRWCDKIMPLFGIDDYQELRDRIKKCVPQERYRYNASFSHPASILDEIKLVDIATLP